MHMDSADKIFPDEWRFIYLPADTVVKIAGLFDLGEPSYSVPPPLLSYLVAMAFRSDL